MNTELLRSFIEVASQESYTRAARTLYLSQPTVYQHVRTMEQVIGVKLVRQVGKRVLLTSEGKVVQEQAMKVLSELNTMLNSVVPDHQDLLTGRIDVVVGTTFGEAVLPLGLGEFRARYPGVSVRVAVIHDTTEIDEAVLRLGYDGGFHSGDHWRTGLDKEPIIKDNLVAVLPIGHRLANADSLTATDIRDEHLISYAKPYGLRGRIEDWAADQGVTFKIPIELNSQAAMVTAVAAGAGMAIVSPLAAVPLIEAGEIQAVILSPPISRDWFFVSRSDSTIPLALRRLVDTIGAVATRTQQECLWRLQNHASFCSTTLIAKRSQVAELFTESAVSTGNGLHSVSNFTSDSGEEL